MVKLKEFSLLEGEEVLQQIEGDAYNDSPNPIMRLIAAVVRIIWLILGVRFRAYIIVTNMRIVEITKKTILWGLLPGHTVVLTLNKKSIQSVGYEMASSWFIFRKFYFLLANASGVVCITYDGNEESLRKACMEVDKIVAAAN